MKPHLRATVQGECPNRLKSDFLSVFLKLMGEHPETRPEREIQASEKTVKEVQKDSGIAGVTDLDAVPVDIHTNIASGVLLEPSVPVAEEPGPVAAPTNTVDENVPVG